jgi:transposase-like protein
VVERPVRRRFTAEYKRAILKEADLCSAGEIGALLRREGLYSSHLSSWRRQRDRGELEALTPKKRGRKAKPFSPIAKENERLRRANDALQRRLAQAEIIIEVQKKIAGLLGIPLNPPENGGNG